MALLHLLRLLLVLPLHFLHLSCAGFLLRHPLMVLLLLLLKLLVLLLLLSVELLLPLLVLSVPFSISGIGRSRSGMRRHILCMDRAGRAWDVSLRTRSGFIRRTRGFIRGMRHWLPDVRLRCGALGWRVIGRSCRLGCHDSCTAKRSSLGSSGNGWPTVVCRCPQLRVAASSIHLVSADLKGSHFGRFRMSQIAG